MDFFKPVATKILALLRAKECMPILTGDKTGKLTISLFVKSDVEWKEGMGVRP